MLSRSQRIKTSTEAVVQRDAKPSSRRQILTTGKLYEEIKGADRVTLFILQALRKMLSKD